MESIAFLTALGLGLGLATLLVKLRYEMLQQLTITIYEIINGMDPTRIHTLALALVTVAAALVGVGSLILLLFSFCYLNNF